MAKTHLNNNGTGYTLCGRDIQAHATTTDLVEVTCGRCLMLHTPPPRTAVPVPRSRAGRDALALHIARHIAYGFAPDTDMLAAFRASDVYERGEGA